MTYEEGKAWLEAHGFDEIGHGKWFGYGVLIALSPDAVQWHARASKTFTPESIHFGYGVTPLEAIANLQLTASRTAHYAGIAADVASRAREQLVHGVLPC